LTKVVLFGVCLHGILQAGWKVGHAQKEIAKVADEKPVASYT
jgi:hypothetical protein